MLRYRLDGFSSILAIDNTLYLNFLKDPYILCWDLRKAVQVVYK